MQSIHLATFSHSLIINKTPAHNLFIFPFMQSNFSWHQHMIVLIRLIYAFQQSQFLYSLSHKKRPCVGPSHRYRANRFKQKHYLVLFPTFLMAEPRSKFTAQTKLRLHCSLVSPLFLLCAYATRCSEHLYLD